jgi:serine protease Do
MDPNEKARVVAVAPGSAAEKAGFRPGDDIETFAGQPILSVADVQWVLHGAGESGALGVEVSRGGATVPLSIALEQGWRQKGDLSWRASSWDLRRMTTGGLVLEALSGADAARLGLTNAMLALEVKHVGGFDEHAAAKKAGFKKGDVFVSVGGKSARLTESELMASLARTTKPGDKVAVTVLRAGAKVDLVLPMQ